MLINGKISIDMRKLVKLLFTITLLCFSSLFLVSVFKITWAIEQSLYDKPKVFQKMQVVNSSKQIQILKDSELYTSSWNSSKSEQVDAFSVSLTNDNFYQVMRRRIEYVKNVCERQHDNGQSLLSKASLSVSVTKKPNENVRIWLLEKEQIAFCPIPKAASTSWKINLLHFRASDKKVKYLINRYNVPEDRLKEVGATFPTIQEWEDYYSKNMANFGVFLFVSSDRSSSV